MDTSNIKNQAEAHRQNSPGDTWDKIDFLLTSRKNNHEGKRLSDWFKYAAAITLISATLFLLNNQLNVPSNAPVFDSTLDIGTVSPLYTSHQIDNLKKAYSKAGLEKNSLPNTGM